VPSYAYKAVGGGGQVESGSIEARTKNDAYDSLVAKNLRPIRIDRGDKAALPTQKTGGLGGTTSETTSRPKLPPRLSHAGVLLFTEELAELLEAGLQLEPALRVMENRQEASPLKAVAGHVRHQIREGVSFSAALRSCHRSFSDLYCNMAAAGEAAGALPRILRRQAEFLMVLSDLQRRVTMALIYPSIVFAAGIMLLIIFMTFLLPQLTQLLSRSGQQLPTMTRMLIATSEFFAAYWWAVILAIAGLIAAFRSWISKPDGRLTWDRIQLRLPLIGPVLRNRFFTQFLQTLATLVTNGVSLLNGIVLMQQATPNLFLKGILGDLAAKVGEGSSLSRSMRQSGVFPAVLMDIIAVGEQTGELGHALQRGAVRYDREFSTRIQQVTALIQPVTILVVALFVGVIAYSMITGILTSVSGIRAQ
jgi:type II secretory pathway component PulF